MEIPNIVEREELRGKTSKMRIFSKSLYWFSIRFSLFSVEHCRIVDATEKWICIIVVDNLPHKGELGATELREFF